MSWRAFFALSLCLAASSAQGQPPLAPPLVNRPAQFSGLVGDYAIRVEASPVDVQVEEPITLRVTLEALGDPPAEYLPDAKKLKLFPPGFEEQFFVEPRPDEHRLDPLKKQWTFVYRLRPKSRQVRAIEDLTLVYWQPRLKKYQTKYADPITLTVEPRREAKVEITGEVTLAPASFYEVPEASRVLATHTPSGIPSWQAMVAASVAPPLASLLGIMLWRRWYPGDAERRRRERQRALRESLDALRAGAPVWPALRAYFAERWDFAAEQPTPVEVAHFFRKRGIAKPLCDRVESLLRGCDALSYAPSPPAESTLRTEAVALLAALEDDPCV
jgi:hypothetical protein